MVIDRKWSSLNHLKNVHNESMGSYKSRVLELSLQTQHIMNIPGSYQWRGLVKLITRNTPQTTPSSKWHPGLLYITASFVCLPGMEGAEKKHYFMSENLSVNSQISEHSLRQVPSVAYCILCKISTLKGNTGKRILRSLSQELYHSSFITTPWGKSLLKRHYHVRANVIFAVEPFIILYRNISCKPSWPCFGQSGWRRKQKHQNIAGWIWGSIYEWQR